MPLIKCPECENEISDKVDTVCPKCGYKVEIVVNPTSDYTGTHIVAFLVGFISIMATTEYGKTSMSALVVFTIFYIALYFNRFFKENSLKPKRATLIIALVSWGLNATMSIVGRFF